MLFFLSIVCACCVFVLVHIVQCYFFSDENFSCDIGELRLSPLFYDNDVLGRLEVCYNGYWGSVCDDSANNMTAIVTCRQLGHIGG